MLTSKKITLACYLEKDDEIIYMFEYDGDKTIRISLNKDKKDNFIVGEEYLLSIEKNTDLD